MFVFNTISSKKPPPTLFIKPDLPFLQKDVKLITDQLFAGETLSRRQKGIHRIELNVLATNAGARQFYAQQGYQVEGCACDAFYLNGQYVDDYSLAYLVPTVATAP